MWCRKRKSNTLKLVDQLNASGNELLKRGSKLIGPATGVYLGIVTSNPSGIILGSAIGEAISLSINDFSNRVLSEKEKNNISIIEAFSIAKILENQETKGEPNKKYFSNLKSGNAQELYEGVLITAKNNYEDKKLEHIAYFYANIIYTADIEPQLSHLLLSTLQSLNFKQLSILSIAGQQEKYTKNLAGLEEINKRHDWYQTRIIQNEISNLMQNGLLHPVNDALITHVSSRHLNKCKLSPVGEILFNLAELNKMDKDDISDILKFFKN